MKTKLTLLAALCAVTISGITSCGPNTAPENDTPTYRVIIAGMTDTAERRNSIDFTNPYYRSDLLLVTRKTDTLSSEHVYTADELSTILKDQVLVSQTGTETYKMLDIFVDNFGAIKANAVDSFTTAAMQVKTGKAFAFTAEEPVALSYVYRNPDDLMVLNIESTILSEENYDSLSVSIGIKKGQDEFVSSMNGALAEITNEERDELMRQMVEFNYTNAEAKDNIRTTLKGSKGTLIVGLECDYPSFNWTEITKNNYTYPIVGKSAEFAEGYDIEIAYRIAKTLDLTLEVEKMEWNALIAWVNK